MEKIFILKIIIINIIILLCNKYSENEKFYKNENIKKLKNFSILYFDPENNYPDLTEL